METIDRVDAGTSQAEPFASPSSVGIAATFTGIGARIQSRLSDPARDAEREWWCRQVLDALPAAVYTTDAAGRVTYYNEAAASVV